MGNGETTEDVLRAADIAAGVDVFTKGRVAQIDGDRSCGTSCRDAVHPAGVPDRTPTRSLAILQRQGVGVVSRGSVRINSVHPLQCSNVQRPRRLQKAVSLDRFRHHSIAGPFIDVGELCEGVCILIEIALVPKFIRPVRQTRKAGLTKQSLVMGMLEANGMTELMQKRDAVKAAGGNRILEAAISVLVGRPVDGHQPFIRVASGGVGEAIASL